MLMMRTMTRRTGICPFLGGMHALLDDYLQIFISVLMVGAHQNVLLGTMSRDACLDSNDTIQRSRDA